MLSRAVTLVILVLVVVTPSRAEHDAAAAKVGDQLVLNMTGTLAVEYARRTGSRPEVLAIDGLSIETVATVARELGDGRMLIEHVSPVIRVGGPARLVTLTATVDPGKMTTDVTPKGTAVYASPDAHRSGVAARPIAEESKSHRLRLSDFKDLKLRTWNLAEEIGD